MVVIVDCDGVLWRGDEAIEGSPEAVDRLRKAGHRLLFVTNNSNPTVGDLLEKMDGLGVKASPDELVTSAQAAATLVEPGSTALVCGGPGVVEALEERDVQTVREGDADAVVVGFHKDFDFAKLTAAFRAVQNGARLIGTNHDPTYPTPEGPVPGGGSLTAAVATAAGVEATFAGKPNEPMANVVRERVGDQDMDGAVLVGDRPSTDGKLARTLGVRFALVLSGVASEELSDPDEADAELVADDLASLVDDDGQLVQESA
jgi:HAD superfamily hydrolase (TIGR01450 family)